MNKTSTRWVLGHKITVHPISGEYDIVTIETPPHVPGPPPHLHHNYREAFIVIEGEMEFMINGETKIVKAGESLEVPPNTIHTFNNKSDQPCKWVDIHSPKGFLGFFDTIGIPIEEENAQERSIEPEIIQKVIATAASFDMRIEM